MDSVYANLQLPTLSDRPFYYSNFVSTLDGKIQINTENQSKYWPIGSKLDYQTLIELRTYADVLIHGKNTAIPHPTINSLSEESFWEWRGKNGVTKPITYLVITNHPTDDLLTAVTSKHAKVKTMIVTSDEAEVSKELSDKTEVVRAGNKRVDLNILSQILFKRGYKHVLMEGGPNLMTQYVKEDLIDEVFLTISPKIIGNNSNTLTMAEGILLSPEEVKKYELISVKNIDSELYLRYKRI